MAGALPLAKRSAQSEWRVQWWWTWMYHAFTLLRKLDDDAGRLRSEMRARRMMRPGLSVSCRVLSYRIVRVSWACALVVVVVGGPSFARVCFATTMRLSDSSTLV